MRTEMLDHIEAVNDGQKSVHEIACERISLLERVNPRVNAVVEYHAETILTQAMEIDKRVSQGKAGRLAGAIVTVKDNLHVKGMKATAGILSLKGNQSIEDSTAVARLRAEDALILGKTNMPPAAMDVQTDNPVYGRTNHPLFEDRTCGGSSGGGACAVRLGVSDLDIGNDIMGSIRIPAHFCGVHGFIPTERAITIGNIAGGSPVGSTISRMLRIGVQSRESENIRFVLPILFDINYPAVPAAGNTKRRIAWSESCGGLPLSKDSKKCFLDFRERLSEQYDLYELKKDDYDFAAARDCYLQLFYGVLSATLSPAVVFILHNLMGQRHMNNHLKKYLTAENNREQLICKLDELLHRYDGLIVPTSATPAFKHQKPDRMQGIQPIYSTMEVDGTKVNYSVANLGYTTPFLTGNPIVSLPIGTTEDGLPVGVQVVGRSFHEYDLFDMVSKLSVFCRI